MPLEGKAESDGWRGRRARSIPEWYLYAKEELAPPFQPYEQANDAHVWGRL